MILYFAGNLIWATRIKGTADALGLACRPVRSVDMLRDRLADSPVRALILDLDAPEPALELLRWLRSDPAGAGRPVRVVAFGPHVEREALQAARDAGADEVLPRGAFDRNLVDILLGLAGRAGGEEDGEGGSGSASAEGA